MLIDLRMAGEILTNQHVGRRGLGKDWTKALSALAALILLLAVRWTPPEFVRAHSPNHATINSVATHGHRLQFDSSGLQWVDPARAFILTPPKTESAHVSLTPELYSALQLKGFHYNRPPPVI